MGNTVGVAVVFSDLVGSTALASELGPVEAERLRVAHFGALREAVERHGGREVKNLGDGIMAVFPGASAALDAAVAMQRGIQRHNAADDAVPMSIRTGVATGDCVEEDGDYFGEPVVQAARLCARAEGGEILAHAVFRILVPRDAHELQDLGELELKGLPEPVPTVRVAWSPESADATIPLQPRLTVPYNTPLIGRDEELQRLRDALKVAANGGRTVLLMTGEAGLGKTRLTSAFASEAVSSGVVVLYGRCDEELARPYLPWVESLDHYVQHADDDALAELDEATVHELARLLPSLDQRRPGAGDVATAQGDQYALVAAVTQFLAAIARRCTTVVVLDDLHWADAASLLLLRHVAANLVDARLLVIGTYRETDLGPDDPLTEVSASLHRVAGVHRLPLDGLSDVEVIALMEGIAGHELDQGGVSLAHTVRADAAGNPFFVVELLRHLVEAGDIAQGADGRWSVTASGHIALPRSVRDVVGQRVRRLGADAHAVLTTAAVIGREFDAEVVAGACDLDEDDVLDRLEDAMNGGLIAEVPGDAERFTFTHALVQHSLYDELSASRRARMHRRVAEAIEAIVGNRPGARVGELANHWFAAVRPSELERAVGYAVQAGERALDASAPEEAVRWFGRALDAVDAEDTELRCALLARLGEAERRAGREVYREHLLEAGAIAERCGRTDVLVESAIENFRGTYSAIGQVDDERVAMLEAALRHVDHADGASRARLLATLAGELTYIDDPRRVEVAQEAMRVARETGDDRVLVDALERIGSALNVPEWLTDRDEQTREAIALTPAGTDPVRRFFALDRRVGVALELSDMAGARACSGERLEIAERLGEPTLRWIATHGESVLDLWEGDIDTARAGNQAAFELGVETGQPDTMLWFAAHVMQEKWHLGLFGETLSLIEMAAEQAPSVYLIRPLRAIFLHNDGQTSEARARVAELAGSGFDIAYDLTWLSGIALTAEAVHLVGDVDSAAILYDRLLPWRDRVTANRHIFFGAVSYHLGLLATTLGRVDDAEHLLLDAIERNGRLRSPMHRTRALVALAELRRAAGRPGVDELVSEAGEAVDRFDIGCLREQVRDLES